MLSADEDLIRERLTQFTAVSGDVQGFDALMRCLKHVDARRHFNREEMNSFDGGAEAKSWRAAQLMKAEEH